MSTPPSFPLPRGRSRWCAIPLFVLFLPLAQSAGAPAGVVEGTVRQAGTEAFLEGAQVTLVERNDTAFTDREGSFRFTAVTPGEYTLRIDYTGLAPGRERVTVGPGGTARVAVILLRDIVQLEAVTVAGEREGNAASITKQRLAPNVMNVVSMDAYGNVADGNIGNFLQNLPGVAANKEGGDIVGVSLRGLPPEMMSVATDGVRSALAVIGYQPQGDRAISIDQIPAESVKEIEVTKASLPEQPADAIGGTVNLVRKSAFDYKQRVATYRAGVNANTYRDDLPHRFTPTFAASYLTTLGADRRWGVAVSGSYTETNNTRDRVQMSHVTGDERNSRARLLNDTWLRTRSGGTANLEYRPAPDLRLWLSGTYNYFGFSMPRYNWQVVAGSAQRIADYSINNRAAILAGAPPRPSPSTGFTTATIAPGYTADFTEMFNATLTNQAGLQWRRQHQVRGLVGLEKKWATAKLKVQGTVNPTWANTKAFGLTTTATGVGLSVDKAGDPTRPVFTQTYGPPVFFPADFTRSTAQRYIDYSSVDEDIGDASADFEQRMTGWRQPVTFKLGASYRYQTRTRSAYNPRWNLVGPDRVQGRNAATGLNDDNIARFVDPSPGYAMFNGRYPAVDRIDANRVTEFFDNNPGHFAASGTTVTTVNPPTDAREDVAGYYVQGATRWHGVHLLGGVRVERTDVETRGPLGDSRRPTERTLEQEGGYTKAFPSLHARYEPRANLILRGSVSTGYARPALGDLATTTNVSYDTSGTGLGRVSAGNPSLKPQYSRNYDLSAEYYLRSAGVVSLGLFRKDLTEFIATATTQIGEGADNGFDGNYAGFDLTTKSNLGSARIEGFELSYSQRLKLLPRPFNDVSVFGNYTRLRTTGAYATGASPLAGYVPHAANAGVTVQVRKWEFRVSYHYKSGYLYTFSAANDGSMVTSDPTVDVNLSYRCRPWLTFYADYINVFNDAPYWYMPLGRVKLVEMSEVYGARLNVGVSGRF